MTKVSDHPLIYVDLIEETPIGFEKWCEDNALASEGDALNSYRAYRLAFQPWRVLVRSGDNQEPLFRSTERYLNEDDARHAVEIAFGSNSNIYLRQKEHGNVLLRGATQ